MCKWGSADRRRVSNYDPRNNCGTHLDSSSLLDSVLLGIRTLFMQNVLIPSASL